MLVSRSFFLERENERLKLPVGECSDFTRVPRTDYGSLPVGAETAVSESTVYRRANR